METRAIERDLEELETRIERLRALYEQYFMGIERLEPQIPRKELERRISLLRKEHIRNTALRFKFQMLIQRYNTLQQYWARVMREIESGTYRRDVMRAALRFGEKEALTILGKKRARQYAKLAEAQAELKKRPTASDLEDEEVELDAEDFIDTDIAISSEEIELDADESPAPQGKSEVIAPAPARRSGVGPPPVPPPLPTASAARGSVPSIAPPARGSSPSSPSLPSLVTAPPLPKPPRPPLSIPAARGSSPSIATAPPLLKPPPLPPSIPAARGSSPSIATAPPLPKPPPLPPPIPAARGSSPSIAPVPPLPKPPPAAGAADESIGEQRLRQIYAKYVETKRQANESTAGVTYEKLVATLRAQTQRLRASHPTKTIDYEVVVKDGKTQLKPILR